MLETTASAALQRRQRRLSAAAGEPVPMAFVQAVDAAETRFAAAVVLGLMNAQERARAEQPIGVPVR